MTPEQLNLDQIPKQLAERFLIGSNNQFFVLVPVVGVNATAYAVTPEHAKEISKHLLDHLEKFEKNVRPIIEGSVSPIQKSDLDSNDQAGPKKK